MKTKPRILVVDDEPRYIKAIRVNLMANGYQVLTARNGDAAIEITADEEPDLILLDIKMPGRSGLEVCRLIREFSTIPIIFLSAMAGDTDKIVGLDVGADDYVTKPFSAAELLARVRAALRRIGYVDYSTPNSSVFQSGDLKVDFAQHRVFVKEREIKLTATEYRILSELVLHKGRVVVPDHLLEKVWGPGHEGEIRLVWQAIHRLRHKLDIVPTVSKYIQTRPGLGYVFEAV
jgi:two-component system KDP operon response regulator KdpE